MYPQLLITFASGRGVLHVADDLENRSGELQRRIDDAIAAGCTCVEVDCRRVRRIGADAFRALDSARDHLESRGGRLLVRCPSHAFDRAARLAGFDRLASRVGRGQAR